MRTNSSPRMAAESSRRDSIPLQCREFVLRAPSVQPAGRTSRSRVAQESTESLIATELHRFDGQNGANAKDFIQPTLLLTTQQTAEALAISPRTLWRLTKSGEISCVRIGRSVRYSPNDLRAWIDERKEGGTR